MTKKTAHSFKWPSRRSKNKTCLLWESFQCSAPKAWNRLPVNINSTRDTGLLKKQLKTFLFLLHTSSVPYLASKQTIVCYRLTVLCIRMLLTVFPGTHVKGRNAFFRHQDADIVIDFGRIYKAVFKHNMHKNKRALSEFPIHVVVAGYFSL